MPANETRSVGAREHAATEGALVAQLRDVGLDADAVSDPYNRRLDYRAAIPLLMEWLPVVPDRRTKESIVRAL